MALVKSSKIHGKGAFADRNFKKGEVVIEWKTKNLLTKEETKKLPLKQKRYVSYFKDGKYILHGIPERYVNHSCHANTKTKNGADVAVRNINKGEEITADYAKEGVPNMNFKCKCGSKHCKGIIKSD
ncbi:MAG: SET domain-containing protein-lysine N-methyltransferase [Nanoarchaeota archaeon]